jgi:adenine deaminase
MSIELKTKRIDMALGNKKADLVIKNINIVNVFTKEIIKGDIAICDSLIVGIGKYEGATEIDGTGKYACPGLIDSHLHIESTMTTPSEFAKAILPHGTTTIIADPHEIANVCGINGIHFMLNNSKNLPLNIYFMMPSCVPATPFENNGSNLTADIMAPLTDNERILGLGEVMDYPSVINKDPNILSKIDLFDNAIIDGHSPNLSGKELNAYRAAGVTTDHECTTLEAALDRLRLGMYVQIRQGSAARNLEPIIKGLLQNNMNFNRCVFCTDDKHLDDIKNNGHISYNVKKAIEYGVNPVDAICMATINAAECYKLKRLGAIAPGYSADIIILDNIENFEINKILFRGKVICNPEICVDFPELQEDANVFNTVRIPELKNDILDIQIKPSTLTPVINIINGDLTTKCSMEDVPTQNGLFIANETYSKIAVIERHKATGNIGLGIVKNFNIKNGAIASTVAHDSHNLLVIGDNDSDMLIAVNELKKCNGGYTVVSEGKVIDTLPLPIAGLMSDKTCDYIEAKVNVMLKAAFSLGINKNIDPFITLSFLALPVIPEIRITDQGLFDVTKFEFFK